MSFTKFVYVKNNEKEFVWKVCLLISCLRFQNVTWDFHIPRERLMRFQVQ